MMLQEKAKMSLNLFIEKNGVFFFFPGGRGREREEGRYIVMYLEI